MCSRPFETRSLPSLLAATHRGFTFYVAFPKGSIRPDLSVLPIYAWHAVASAKEGRSRPRGSVHSLLCVDHSHGPVLAPASPHAVLRNWFSGR